MNHSLTIKMAPMIFSMKFARILKHLTIDLLFFSEWVLSGPDPIRTLMRPGPSPNPVIQEAGTQPADPFFPHLSNSPSVSYREPWGVHGGGVHQWLAGYSTVTASHHGRCFAALPRRCQCAPTYVTHDSISLAAASRPLLIRFCWVWQQLQLLINCDLHWRTMFR